MIIVSKSVSFIPMYDFYTLTGSLSLYMYCMQCNVCSNMNDHDNDDNVYSLNMNIMLRSKF